MKKFVRATNNKEKIFNFFVIAGSFFMLLELVLFIIGCVVPRQINLVTSIMEAIGILILLIGTILVFLSKEMFLGLEKNKYEMLAYRICVDDVTTFIQNISLGFRQEGYYSIQLDNELHEDIPLAFVKEQKLSKKIVILTFSEKLNDKTLGQINDFSEKIISDFGKASSLSIARIVCVNHISYSFSKFLEEQPRHKIDIYELFAGVVLSEKKLYINSIVKGIDEYDFKQIKKELLRIMNKIVT